MVSYIASQKGGKIPYKNMISFDYKVVTDNNQVYIFVLDIQDLHKKLYNAVNNGISFFCFDNRIYIDLNDFDSYFVISQISDDIFNNISQQNIFNLCIVKSFFSDDDKNILDTFGCDDLKFI